HDHLHEIVAHLLKLLLLAQALLERVRRRLQLEQRADARTEYESVVRLRQEVVATGLDRLDAIRGVVERRDEDDGDPRRARIALDAATDLEAGRAVVDTQIARRHRDVENAEVGMSFGAHAKGRGAIVRRHGPEAEDVKL